MCLRTSVGIWSKAGRRLPDMQADHPFYCTQTELIEVGMERGELWKYKMKST